MAAKRRKIVQEDLDMGTSTSSIPTDSGGTRTGTQVNPALAYNTTGYKSAAMSGGTATVTTEQDLTGATVSLDRVGIWWIIGTFDFDLDASSNAGGAFGKLNVDGTNEAAFATTQFVTTGQRHRGTVSQNWIITISSQPITAKLRAILSTGTAILNVNPTHTTIRAFWLGVS